VRKLEAFASDASPSSPLINDERHWSVETRGEALIDIARSYALSHSTISRLGALFSA
jgi:hypothetical protein